MNLYRTCQDSTGRPARAKSKLRSSLPAHTCTVQRPRRKAYSSIRKMLHEAAKRYGFIKIYIGVK